MPYIITTRNTDCGHNDEILTEDGLVRCEDCGNTAVPGEGWLLSRTAVATLDEAWDKLPPGIRDTDLVRLRFALENGKGGTIGPLPDGTVIEVRPVDWRELIQTTLDAGEDNYPPLVWDTAEDRAAILVAYNAA